MVAHRLLSLGRIRSVLHKSICRLPSRGSHAKKCSLTDPVVIANDIMMYCNVTSLIDSSVAVGHCVRHCACVVGRPRASHCRQTIPSPVRVYYRPIINSARVLCYLCVCVQKAESFSSRCCHFVVGGLAETDTTHIMNNQPV